jgi:hypothetical protein
VESDENKSCILAIKTYALIAILDYFNCHTKEEDGDGEDGEKEPKTKKRKQTMSVFRKKCETKVMPLSPNEKKDTSDWVLEFLWQQISKTKGTGLLLTKRRGREGGRERERGREGEGEGWGGTPSHLDVREDRYL